MMDDETLDHLFAAAREDARPVPAGLTLRVLDDAAEVQAAPSFAAPFVASAPPAPRRSGFLASLAAVFGGMGALSGMATAAVAGFWIGFAQPAQLDAMNGLLTGASAEIDMMPGLDALLDEAP